MLLAFLKNAGVPKNANKNFSKKRYKRKGGSRGCSPCDASPSGGARGSLSYSLIIFSSALRKNQMNFCSRLYQKPCLPSILFFKPPAFRKTIACMEADAALIKTRDADKDSRISLFFHLRNNQSGTNNEYRNIREKKELML
jgi:hypothetical protein